MKKLALCLILIDVAASALWAMPSQITFQGTLKQNGVPVNTTENMQFSFVDNTGATIPGTQPITVNNVSVVNGLFAVNLPIDPTISWVQYSPYIRVAVQGQILSPDQPINANLYALAAIPAGIIVPFGGQTPPPGWFLCDGSSKSRSAFTGLFQAIGTTWGAVDSSSFNVPDLRGRTPIGMGQGLGLTNRSLGQILGEESHTQTINEMPAHSHSLPPYNNFIGGSGPGGGVDAPAALGGNNPFINTASAGGGAPFNVMQPSAVVNYIIKY